MKKIFILIILFFQALYSQSDIKLIIPVADCFSSDTEIKNMWVGKNNFITTNYVGGDDIIKIWTDNGKVDSGNYYYSNYCIIPSREGLVTVSSLIRIRNNKDWDTISAKGEFIAIEQPEIITRINKELLEDSLILDFSFIYEESNEPIEENDYLFYPFNYTIKVFRDNSEVGDIEFYTEKEEARNILSKGNIIHLPTFTLIDNKYSLFIGTPEKIITYKKQD